MQIGAGLLKQSFNMWELKAWWSRVWAGWWWITAFILCSVYTGNLVAVLTVPSYPKLINTVEDLAESSLRLDDALSLVHRHERSLYHAWGWCFV